MQSTPQADRNPGWQAAGICVFLAAVTFAVFCGTFQDGFVNLDDDLIVAGNPHVAPGLSGGAALWVFTHFDSFFYTPLTSISHMADCSLFGSGPGNAGGHHFVNVLLHALSVIVLFLVLRGMTGALWRSAFVATVFAIHPLHVESVAWVSERKDVLSGLFFMLALGAYARYARRPQSPARYLLVVLLFLLALLSKPVVVTLPFVFLLLDYWPLGRFESNAKRISLVVEKIPLLALSAAACVAAVLAQGDAIQTVQKFPLPARLANAALSCVTYIAKTFHPARLAVFYPYPAELPAWKVAASLALLLAISALVWAFGKSRRYLVTGWLWYLGMLVPVAGFVQVGEYARADRFTYLPQIGLCIMATWAVADLCAGRRRGRLIAGLVMGVAVVELAAIAWAQTAYWKNSEELWTHALACTEGNYQAEDSLGSALLDQGHVEDAILRFKKSLGINPRYTFALNNLGVAQLRLGKIDDAAARFREALDIDPSRADVHNSLGDAYYAQGNDRKAAAEYEKALAISPDYVMAQSNLAWILATSPEDSLRNGPRAVQLADAAYAVAGDLNPVVIRTLAAARAESGQFPAAEQTALHALQAANSQGNSQFAALLQSEIELYRSRIPFRHKRVIPALPPPPAMP